MGLGFVGLQSTPGEFRFGLEGNDRLGIDGCQGCGVLLLMVVVEGKDNL